MYVHQGLMASVEVKISSVRFRRLCALQLYIFSTVHEYSVIWRAGASQPSRVIGPIFLYIYIYIYIYIYVTWQCTYHNVIRASNFACT